MFGNAGLIGKWLVGYGEKRRDAASTIRAIFGAVLGVGLFEEGEVKIGVGHVGVL